MNTKSLLSLLLLVCLISSLTTALEQSNEPPVIPVGLDAYRMWDRLPYHRIGVRAYMRSTYDREGNNRTADASHYLYQESDTFNVSLDVEGPGVLYFRRTNHWHGSPWHYEVDGEDFIVKETATDNPVGAKERFEKTSDRQSPLARRGVSDSAPPDRRSQTAGDQDPAHP